MYQLGDRVRRERQALSFLERELSLQKTKLAKERERLEALKGKYFFWGLMIGVGSSLLVSVVS